MPPAQLVASPCCSASSAVSKVPEGQPGVLVISLVSSDTVCSQCTMLHYSASSLSIAVAAALIIRTCYFSLGTVNQQLCASHFTKADPPQLLRAQSASAADEQPAGAW